MSGKSMVMLVLALVCGLGAMYGTSRLLSKQGKTKDVMQDVLVAARDLKVEEVLKPEMVKVVKMSKAELPVGNFLSYKEIEDRWIQIKTLEGEPILDRKLAPKGSPAGLVSRIPKDMRGFTIEVSESTGVSGFVLPDHRVDVVRIAAAGGDSMSGAETVVQDVLVLASGQVFNRPDDRSIQSKTVTLLVTPNQVEALTAARTKGPLALSLRGLDDHKVLDCPKPKPPAVAVALNSIEAQPPTPASAQMPRPAAPEPAPAPTPMRYVTIYRGIDSRQRVLIEAPGPDGGEETPSSAPFQ